MKLTPEQIDRLYQFTRQHYVEYYDLQTELVDHLANAIEEQWQENPKVSFEDALQMEFKKFGVFGFMNVVEERELVLYKKYHQIVWRHLRSFYGIPRIVITLISIGLVFKILKIFNGFEGVIGDVFFILFMLSFVGLVIRSRKKAKQFKTTGKKWLFDKILSGPGYMFFFFQIVGQSGFRFSGANYQDWVLWFASFMIVSFVIVAYIVFFLIPSKAEQYLKETYPEYELSK